MERRASSPVQHTLEGKQETAAKKEEQKKKEKADPLRRVVGRE